MSEEPAVYSISITGHRPGDLRHPDGTPADLARPLVELFARASERARARGAMAIEIVTGGALGVDQAVADAVGRVRASDLAFTWRSVVILPFPVAVMAAKWTPEQRANLERLVAEADELVGPLSETYQRWIYLKRNEAMVDRSHDTVAFWSGKKEGGTFACIRYALEKAKPPRHVYNALDGFRPIKLPL